MGKAPPKMFGHSLVHLLFHAIKLVSAIKYNSGVVPVSGSKTGTWLWLFGHHWDVRPWGHAIQPGIMVSQF